MNLKIKKFNQFNTNELFEILKLRVKTFVVEQNSTHQEIDDFDKIAIHIWFEEDGKIIAYLRLFPYENVVKIGRVFSVQKRKGFATKLMQEAIQYIQKNYTVQMIQITAQVYVQKLYEKIGFIAEGNVYLENEIPHIVMKMAI